MNKILKWGKRIGVGVSLLLVILFVLVKILSKPLPEGVQGTAADAIAHKMLEAIGDTAWQEIHYLQWTYPGNHEYLWDKKNHFVQVLWGKYEAKLDLKSISGLVKKSGKPLNGTRNDKMVQKAWSLFCNDSFWVCAPNKVFDPGTERYLVKNDSDHAVLRVTYTSGGTTPGDSYVWTIDSSGLPVKCSMYTFIPIQGIEFGWENWAKLDDGALIALSHPGLVNVRIENLKGGTAKELGIAQDIFADLEERR